MTSRYISFKWYEKLSVVLAGEARDSFHSYQPSLEQLKKNFIFYHWLTSAGRLLSSSFSPSELKRKEPREPPNPQVGPLSTETFLTPRSGAHAGKRQCCGTHGFQVWNHRHLWVVVTVLWWGVVSDHRESGWSRRWTNKADTGTQAAKSRGGHCQGVGKLQVNSRRESPESNSLFR